MKDRNVDLLTQAYIAYLTQDFDLLMKIGSIYKDCDNVVASLKFKKENEMKREYHPLYFQKNISVLDMFKKSKSILDTVLPDINFYYCIDGIDYIEDCNELEKLQDEGLDALIVYENIDSSDSLSDKGLELVSKAESLGLGLDLCNIKNLDKTINKVKNKRRGV